MSSYVEVSTEEESETPRYSPQDSASLLSRISFWWVQPLISIGTKKILVEHDIPNISAFHKLDQVEEDWQTNLDYHKNSFHKRPMLRSFLTFGTKHFIICAVLGILNSLCRFSLPLVLRALLEWLQSPETQSGREHVGFLLAFGLFFAAIGQGVFIQHYFWNGMSSGLRYKGAMMISTLNKVFKLTTTTKRTVSSGFITNLASVDSSSVMNFIWNPHYIWISPLFVICNFFLLVYIIGWSAFATLGVMGIIFPLNAVLFKFQLGFMQSLVKITDQRVSRVTELLEGIKLVKLYNWEDCFKKRIEDCRDVEIGMIRKILYIRSIITFANSVLPAAVSLAVLFCYSFFGGELDPVLTFTVIASINNFSDPILRFQDSLAWILQSSISMKRFGEFEELPDIEEPQLKKDLPHAVEIEGDFSWNASSIINSPKNLLKIPKESLELNENAPVTLPDLNLRIPHGKLVIVVGPIGSGKSTLLGAILGEVRKLRGRVEISGHAIHTSQSPWLLNASLKENVCFMRPYNKEKYQETISACSLIRDLSQLPAGDDTEIGERGINLSGGQKQRVSLARAVYRREEADIYLLDEPLGAVDPAVADRIFHECIGKTLRGKTRILVTHQLQFLPFADLIYVMKDGRVTHQGTYEGLLKSGIDFSEILRTRAEKLRRMASSSSSLNLAEAVAQAKASETTPDDEIHAEVELGKGQAKSAGKLVQEETRDVGGVDRRLYVQYFKSGKFWLFVVVLSLYFVAQGVKIFTDYLLVWWSADTLQKSTGFYMALYGGSFGGFTILVFIREVMLINVSLGSARNLHNSMLASIMRSPMSFFDSTPLGRILNRFSKDQDVIDKTIAELLSEFGISGIVVFATIVLVCILSPWLILPMVLIGAMYYLVQSYYRQSARELTRMDAVSKSPVFSYFSEATNGVSVIRNYRCTHEFAQEFKKRVENNFRAFYWLFAANRWLGLRLELVGACVVFATALVNVLTSNANAANTALIGLSISYTFALTGNLNWSVRMWTELEIAMNSVSRIVDYTKLEPEAALEVDSDPSEEWPADCSIELEDLSLRYKEGTENVLNAISCRIEPKEKVGIVGRTGAGKSSLTAALFRLSEASEGSIKIDQVDIAQIGLRRLRNALSIIPQDPLLFYGTVRFNLDPVGVHSDDELWIALRKVGLEDLVRGFSNGMDELVVENGDNFSLGQKQLISLVRVILRRARILILDEATSSLDLETDEKIQSVVRSEFRDSTVLTIAHRLDTIIDSDRVMVLDKGELKEFNSPSTLLSSPGTLFNRLVESAIFAANHSSNA